MLTPLTVFAPGMVRNNAGMAKPKKDPTTAEIEAAKAKYKAEGMKRKRAELTQKFNSSPGRIVCNVIPTAGLAVPTD
jgi:hypothetical protein